MSREHRKSSKRARASHGEPSNPSIPIPHVWKFSDSELNVGFDSKTHYKNFLLLKKRGWVPTMWCDIEVCSKTGIIGFLHDLLIEHGWFKRLLSSRENSYRDLTLEFLATLTFNLDDANPVLSFQL